MVLVRVEPQRKVAVWAAATLGALEVGRILEVLSVRVLPLGEVLPEEGKLVWVLGEVLGA